MWRRLFFKRGPRPNHLRSMGRIPLVVLLAGLAIFVLACGSEANERNKAGVDLMKVGELEKSIVEFDKATRADPKMVLAHYNRAQAYFKLGQFDAARDVYDQAVSLDPESSLFYTKRGDTYLAMGQYGRAVQDYDQAISLDPRFALAYYDRGGAYVELGRGDEAIEDYKKAVSLDHRLGITNHVGARCEVYDDLYSKDVAYQDCRGFYAYASRFASAFGERGFERFERGEYRKAISDYGEAIRLDSSSELYNNRALARRGMGQFDQAFDDFQTAIGRFGYAPAYYNQGELLYELGEYQFAAKDYSRVILMDSRYVDAYVGRALAYTHLEKDKLAKLDIGRAVELGFDRAELEGAIQELKTLR